MFPFMVFKYKGKQKGSVFFQGVLLTSWKPREEASAWLGFPSVVRLDL